MKQLSTLALLATLLLTACAQPKDIIYRGVEHFGLKQSGLTNTMLIVDLKLYNPNKYALMLKASDVAVYINNNHVGQAYLRDKKLIPARDTFILPVVMSVDLLHVIPNAIQLLTKKEITLKLDGNIRAGRHGIFMVLPINYEGKQKIDIKF
jgi:LEA14-like dessication related protein